jgi:hypothetical protein
LYFRAVSALAHISLAAGVAFPGDRPVSPGVSNTAPGGDNANPRDVHPTPGDISTTRRNEDVAPGRVVDQVCIIISSNFG